MYRRRIFSGSLYINIVLCVNGASKYMQWKCHSAAYTCIGASRPATGSEAEANSGYDNQALFTIYIYYKISDLNLS